MRLRSFSNVLTLATASSLAVASPSAHRHHRGHVNKREPDNVKTVDVPGPTVVAYKLNGNLIDQSEVCKGIKNGTMKWADGTEAPPACSLSADPVPQPAQTTLATSVITDAAPVTTNLPSSVAIPEKLGFQKLAIPNPGAPSSAPAPSQSSSSSSDSSNISSGKGLDDEFPDGTIECSTFPSDYGPIDVAWAKLGGWSGIQYVTIEGDSITHIDTATPGGACKPGAMCSYACPPGYQKSQWPSAQGSTGQSVGGLQCNENGKLVLTNPGLSKKLCIKGTGAVTVQNKLSNNAAICRTDYPGTESESVPLDTQPDSTNPLTCPDASNYYKHESDATSAQYYINQQDVAVQNACTWGTDGSSMGNWAPAYLGVGQDTYGKTWLSISTTKQNNPSTYSNLNYTVEITGDTSGKCKLSNGKYCSGDSYDDCNDEGCTVELMSGQATYVLSDS